MRFTTRGLNLLFSHNADTEVGDEVYMSRPNFMKVVTDIISKSIWKTTNIERQRLSIDEVLKFSAPYFNTTPKQLISKSSKREFVEPRMLIALYLRNYNFPLQSIGLKFGGKHHGTILHYEQVGKDLLETNPEFAKKYADLKYILDSQKTVEFNIT